MIDQLDFKKFKKYSNDKISLPTDYNRLIAHTDNFFVISGYGAFDVGYYLLIPKILYSSFGEIEKLHYKEINFWVELIKEFYQKKLNKNIFIYEHGMCGCLGGLDRAHLHLSPANLNVNKMSIIKIVNHLLKRRGVGLKKIKYNNIIIDNRYDIELIIKKSFNFEVIEGDLISGRNIIGKKKLLFPFGLHKFSENYTPYNFFYHGEAYFLRDLDVSTQFGREITYFLNRYINVNDLSKIEDENWKWQLKKNSKNILLSIEKLLHFLRQKNLTKNNFNLKLR